jgi:hypothetical protein
MAVEIESKLSEMETLNVLKASLLILRGDNFGIKAKEKTIPEMPKTISIMDIMLSIDLLIKAPVLKLFVNCIHTAN